MASGNGSNAQRIMEYFSGHPWIRVEMVLSNNPQAYVLKRAKTFNIPTLTFDRHTFYHTNQILDILSVQSIDWIILAGFLWLIPGHLLDFYPNHILNIHPALLPKYGGKGMYGQKVHQEVIKNGDQISGITIHFVNEKYDDGQIIFQSKCQVSPEETAETLAGKIHLLEYRWFPEIIEQTLNHHPSSAL